MKQFSKNDCPQKIQFSDRRRHNRNNDVQKNYEKWFAPVGVHVQTKIQLWS